MNLIMSEQDHVTSSSSFFPQQSQALSFSVQNQVLSSFSAQASSSPAQASSSSAQASSSSTPNKKKGGRPKSIIWETYIQQGRKISQGHYNATCKFCKKKWHKVSPEECENYLANFCQNVPSDTRDLFLNCLAAQAIERNP